MFVKLLKYFSFKNCVSSVDTSFIIRISNDSKGSAFKIEEMQLIYYFD